MDGCGRERQETHWIPSIHAKTLTHAPCLRWRSDALFEPVVPDRPSQTKKTGGLAAMFARASNSHLDQLKDTPPEPVSSKSIKSITKAEMVQTFEDHQMGALRALTVSPDSTMLYSGGEDKKIRVWSVGTGGCALQYTLSGAHSGWIWSLLVSPDGRFLFSASGDCTIRMWSCGTAGTAPEPRHVLLGHEESVCSLAISKDSAFLYSGSDDRSIRVWDISAGESSAPRLLQVLTGHTGYVSSLALSPDGLTLYSAGMSGDNSIKMWRVCGTRPEGGGPAPTCTLLTTLSAHTMGVYTITLSPDGRLLYSGGEDKSILVWRVDPEAGSGQVLNSLEGAHDKWVRSLRLTPDGRTLVSGSADTTIGLWAVDARGSAQLLQVLRRHTDRVRCVRVSPDARFLYSASSDNTIRLWALISE